MGLQPKDKEKRIEPCVMRAGDIRTGFGNPRKIKRAERDKLKRSMEESGDFGVYVIDENDNIIAGNQRLSVAIEINPDMELECKRLIGYSEAEKRYINLKANTHSGDWDLEILSQWTADLNMDLGIKPKPENPEKRKIPDMELIRYEKYDYIMIVCRNEVDYKNLQRKLGIDGRKMLVCPGRRIQARAIWYDDIAAQIVRKDEVENENPQNDEEEEGENQ